MGADTPSPYNPVRPPPWSPVSSSQQSPPWEPLTSTQQSPPWEPHTSPQQFQPWSAPLSPTPSPDPVLRPSFSSPGVPALLVRTPPSSPPLFDTQDLIAIQSEKVLSVTFIDNVNIIILYLLNSVVYKYLEENCYGCQINHPGQKHHDCVWGIPDDFYETNFDQLTERLWNDRFISVIQTFLTTKGIFVNDFRTEELLRP